MRIPPILLSGLLLALGGTKFPQTVPRPGETPSELSGRISLATKNGPIPAIGSVVWLPDVPSSTPSQEEPRIVSQGKRFQPHVLAVEAGTRVFFPNLDQVYHNVFSLSPPNAFDLGLYRRGAVPSVLFKGPGLVRIYCNIHPDMAAYVMVLEGAAFAVTGVDGFFHIPGISPGRHRLKVWNERGGEQEATLDFEAGKEKDYSLALDASNYRQLAHKNKHGQDYAPLPNDDRY
jgi:plastocyanin